MRGLKSTLLRGFGTAAVVVSFVAFGASSAQAADGWDARQPGWDAAPGWDAKGWDVKGWDAKQPGWDVRGWDARKPGWD